MDGKTINEEINLEVLSAVNIYAWIIANDVKTENGVPVNFDDYGFMRDVYLDDSPFICASKAAQIGFTTYEILKSAFEANTENIDIIYVLPTAEDVRQFSGGKTNRIIANNPSLQEWTRDKDSIEQKRFGRATIYYRGAQTERAALMISAQKLIIDELDRCPPAIVEQYDSRLQATPDPRKAFFSNPSRPDFGISKFYAMSDKKIWHVRHACGSTFPLTEECIDYDTEAYRCPFCDGEITDRERREGWWKATGDPKARWSGYWIPLWITPWTSAKKIAEEKRNKSPEYFANFVAGLPYVAGGDKVSESTIFNCLSLKVNSHAEPVIIGVDTGLPIHIVCGNKEGFFYYATLPLPGPGVDPYVELEKLMIRWPRSIVIADQGGDLIGIRNLQAKYPGRVFLVWYRRDAKGVEIIKWGTGDNYGEVTADRNRLIQLFIEEMNDRRAVFNSTGGDRKQSEDEWREYVSHWLNIYREWQENALGIREFKWERNGPDHFVHATIYARIGLDRFAAPMAQIAGAPDVFGERPAARMVEVSPSGEEGMVILGPRAEM
ncbi:MAG: phage terminase large subunit family protein [Patescibacteria group bacterium]|nr:phage terminase large subunit family protein [Patescibacteria group bacterium]MDE2233079.1 phage terminase large subunit family protein [Patescibacteria group bacterium]